jgi:hypothetical protein
VCSLRDSISVEHLAVTGKARNPPRKARREMKSTGSRGSRSETAALRTSQANGDTKSAGDWLEYGIC